ncbi:MAG: hypothetical protein ACRBN8_10410 [Nannocystales bacterium]
MLGTTLALASLLAMQPAAGTKRSNDAHARKRGPVFSVVAAPRLGILLAGGSDVMQPLGFGAGFSFRIHGLRLGPIRLGAGVDLGHTRFIERRRVEGVLDNQEQFATRYAALAHSDFGAGPSLQIVLGPVYLQGDLTVGVGISSFVRPLGILTTDEEHHSDVSAMIRTGGLIGIPIRNNQGVTLGASVQRYFSTYQIVAQPQPEDPALVPAEPDTNPFDLVLDVSVGYLFMF